MAFPLHADGELTQLEGFTQAQFIERSSKNARQQLETERSLRVLVELEGQFKFADPVFGKFDLARNIKFREISWAFGLSDEAIKKLAGSRFKFSPAKRLHVPRPLNEPPKPKRR